MGLLPPTVGERLAKCGTQVGVWGISPGADVTLDFGSGQQTVKVTASATTFTVSGGLTATARVRAFQQLPPDNSGWGNVVEVEDALLPPAAPLMEASIARCAACVGAWGAAPGSRIELTQGGVLLAAGDVGGDGLACLTMTSRPISPMDSAAITCGVPSSAKGWVKVHDVPDPLPAPTIVPPVFECQNRILVEGLMPGATAEVFVIDRDNVKQSLGTFCACASRSSVGLPRVMKPGDRLTIVQTMINDRWQCHVRGRESGETPVVPPDARIKPVLQGPLYAGDTILRVTNQIEGGTITLLRQQNIFAGEDDLGSRPSISDHPEVPVPLKPLETGQILRVRQELCGVQEFSDPVPVLGPPPVIDPPRLRKPLNGCSVVVVVDQVIPGATVRVKQTPPNVLVPEYPIGSTWSPGTSTTVRVYPALTSESYVVAYQEVGGKPSGPSARVKVDFKEGLPLPSVPPPVRVGDTTVFVADVVPGAHVRVFDRGSPLGSADLPGTDGSVALYWPVPDGAILTARQSLCFGESGESAPRPAVGTAACDGPPVYDADKWNTEYTAVHCNNCYNYACDIRTDNFAQPGYDPVGPYDPPKTCTDAEAGALKDGLQRCTGDHCHPCHHRVALAVWPGHDYHWYRQDKDGMWSEKRGWDPARNVDQSGNSIYDPATADRTPYSDFCGYFCVYKPNVHIEGPRCPD